MQLQPSAPDREAEEKLIPFFSFPNRVQYHLWYRDGNPWGALCSH